MVSRKGNQTKQLDMLFPRHLLEAQVPLQSLWGFSQGLGYCSKSLCCESEDPETIFFRSLVSLYAKEGGI